MALKLADTSQSYIRFLLVIILFAEFSGERHGLATSVSVYATINHNGNARTRSIFDIYGYR